MSDPRVGVARHDGHNAGRVRVRVKLLFILLFAAALVVTWRLARTQPDSALFYVSPNHDVASTSHNPSEPARDDPFAPVLPAHGVNRPVYPYSVIPGGVHSLAELQHDIQEDPVVARQYRGFDFQHARLLQVSQPQAMFVSYRIGQKVYWTRKKVALHQGETLITDGKTVVRARCGNQVAKSPLDTGSPLEPPVEDFERPYSAMITAPTATPVLTAAPAALPLPVGKSRRWWMLPLFAAPLGGLADPGSPGSFHDPLAVTPEPATTLLMVSGLAGVYWRVRRSRKKS